MTAPIEVLAIRKLDGRSAVKAFVDVRVGGLVLKGGKVVCREGQRPWYATPSVKTDHGWQQVVEIKSKDLRQRITTIVLQAWETHNQPQVIPPTREAAPGILSRTERDEHVEELARRFDERGDDPVPF